MAFSKTLISGVNGSVVISEDAGVATVKASAIGSFGGGELAGVAKVVASAEVDISAIALVDAGLLLVEAKFPTLAPMVAMLKAAIDAEVGKI